MRLIPTYKSSNITYQVAKTVWVIVDEEPYLVNASGIHADENAAEIRVAMSNGILEEWKYPKKR